MMWLGYTIWQQWTDFADITKDPKLVTFELVKRTITLHGPDLVRWALRESVQSQEISSSSRSSHIALEEANCHVVKTAWSRELQAVLGTQGFSPKPQLSTPGEFGRGLRVQDEMAAWLIPEISLMKPEQRTQLICTWPLAHRNCETIHLDCLKLLNMWWFVTQQ